MSTNQKSKQESTTSEVPEEVESYPVYTLNGAVTITISGNNNVVTILSGQPSPPVKPPGGGNG